MSNLKIIELNKLKPIQNTVLAHRLDYYNLLDTIPPPEVWKINDLFYIGDGHHRIFNFYQRNNSKIRVLVHSKTNWAFSTLEYQSIAQEILNQAKKVQKENIFFINQLKVI